jgi:hypothetical protein
MGILHTPYQLGSSGPDSAAELELSLSTFPPCRRQKLVTAGEAIL